MMEAREGLHGTVVDIIPGSLLICRCYEEGGPKHSHPEKETFYAISGQGKIASDNFRVDICKGESITARPNTPHGIEEVSKLLLIVKKHERGI